MRICIFGAGSLGSALGGLLARENDVTVIGRRPHVSAIRKEGLRLTGNVRRIVWMRASETVEGVGPPDLLVICTKAFDTAEAVATCRRWAGRETLVLTLQNGLGNLEMLREWKGRKALGGTTTLGATLTSPGVVRISGLGRTLIGSDLNAGAAERVARTFSAAGIPSSLSRDVFGEIWTKSVVSACINPTTAVLRVPNGVLLESSVISKFLDAVCYECVSIARACDVNLDDRAMRARVRSVARDTARNTSSMLQDVQRGRRTEIAFINGAFCLFAMNRGVPFPLNRTLTAMVEALEAQTCGQKG